MSWAHRTIYLTFDADWHITYSDGQTIVGMQAILDYEGTDGWELVAAVVEDRAGPRGTRQRRCLPAVLQTPRLTSGLRAGRTRGRSRRTFDQDLRSTLTGLRRGQRLAT